MLLQTGLTDVCDPYCINWFATCENKSSQQVLLGDSILSQEHHLDS